MTEMNTEANQEQPLYIPDIRDYDQLAMGKNLGKPLIPGVLTITMEQYIQQDLFGGPEYSELTSLKNTYAVAWNRGRIHYLYNTIIPSFLETARENLSDVSKITDDELLVAVALAYAHKLYELMYSKNVSDLGPQPFNEIYDMVLNSEDVGISKILSEECITLEKEYFNYLQGQQSEFLSSLTSTLETDPTAIVEGIISDVNDKWESNYKKAMEVFNIREDAHEKIYTKKQASVIMAAAYTKYVISVKKLECSLTDEDLLRLAAQSYQKKFGEPSI